jgi:hypothetical protein
MRKILLKINSPTVNGEVCGECVGCRDVKEIIKIGVVPDEDNPFI